MKILVVEDVEVNRKMLAHYLAPVADTDFATNGIQAVQKFNRALNQAPYTLICLDIMMPHMDGIKTVMALRKIEATKGIPPEKAVKVLVITSNPSKDNVTKIYKYCQGFMIKPITARKLYEKLEETGIQTGVRHSEIENFIEKYFKKKRSRLLKTEPPSPEIKPESKSGAEPEVKGIPHHEIPEKVILKDDKVSILNFLNIKGPVKENIDFAGAVKIKGDLRAGIKITALSGISIDGKTESCSLHSDGDIKVYRIDGHGKTEITAGGNFFAQFLYEASVRAKGTATIEKESINSEIRAIENVQAGAIVGGSCMSLKTIATGRAGSPKDVSTSLCAGYDFTIVEELKKSRSKSEGLKEKLEKLNGHLGIYAENPLEAMKLPYPKMKRILEMEAEKLMIKYSELPDIEANILELEKKLEADKNASVKISGTIYNGVSVSIGDKKLFIHENQHGPLTVRLPDGAEKPEINKG